MAIIVLEGPDGAGKSSLARTAGRACLTRGIVPRILHFGPPPPAPAPGSMEWAYDLGASAPVFRVLLDMVNTLHLQAERFAKFDLPPERYMLIIDRFHVGPAVYGELYRPTDCRGDGFGELGLDLTADIDKWVDRFGISALVTGSVETLATRIAARGDDYLDSQATTDADGEIHLNVGEVTEHIRDTVRALLHRYDYAVRLLPSFRTDRLNELRVINLDAISDGVLEERAERLVTEALYKCSEERVISL